MTALHPLVRLSASGLPVDGAIPLDVAHGARLGGIVSEELGRYPVMVGPTLPALHLVESADLGGHAVGARYLPDQHAGLLSARHDLRGNVHRVVARALIEKNPDAAAALLAQIDAAGEDGQLYRGLLGRAAAAAAVVGAVVHRRSSLDEASRQYPALQRAVTAARQFLTMVGIDDTHLRSLAPAAPYAYLSRIVGQRPHLRIEPGDVPLTVGPPPAGMYPDNEFEALSEEEAALAQRAIERAVWYIPEGVLGESVKNLFVVADVRMASGCDIAGFASGYLGEAASVVVEHRRGRRTIYHELAHALHYRFHDRFPEAAWRALVPSSGGYFGSGKSFIEAGVSLRDYSAELLDRGFITGYSSASLEEDVAEIFEAVMVGDPRLAAAIPDSKRIEAKVQLMVGFLRSVDPTFSDDFFLRLRVERASQEAAWGVR